ncbi:MAG TPA: MgtC/SapB family protein [Methylovirgula sp.]|nr:MgtC/SapB family protein [Methylovirgula sp.]
MKAVGLASFQEWELVARLLLAAVLGSFIGIERERLAWAAGLRTHMLVSVGACLIMIVSAYGFNSVLNSHVVLDPSRVAAQVVSGIGFLGAGTILLRGEIVRGLTTAASLWAVAAIGLAVGSGLYLEATAATVIMLAILTAVKPFEEWLQHRNRQYELYLWADPQTVSIDILNEVLGYRAKRITRFVRAPDDDGASDKIQLSMTRLPSDELTDVLNTLGALPFVRKIAQND